MCYTVNTEKAKAIVEKATKAKIINDDDYLKASFLSGFGHPKMLMIKQENPSVLDIANWGLVPSFIKDATKAKEYFINTLNAKSETIFEKVSFKNSILPRRCLIPISGFYEWRDINKIKYPYYITAKDKEIICVGGIYDNWVDRITGEIHTTFSMVTTEGNPLMNKIHNLKQRQPLLMTNINANAWLRNDLKESDIKELMRPMPEELMAAHTIKRISPKTIDIFNQNVHDEFEYPELVMLDAMG